MSEGVAHRRAEPVLDVQAELGEGVVWDDRARVVRWVDIARGELHCFDPDSGRDETTDIGRSASAVGLRDDGGLVLATSAGFVLVDASGQEETTIPAGLADGTRMNDAKPGPAGRFWAGTMAYDKTRGAAVLMRLDPDRSVVTVLDDLTIPNGLDWSADHTRMHFVDTPTGHVDVFDHAPDTGQITNRRHVVDVTGDSVAGVPAGSGSPDGMTLDADDAVWVAVNGVGQVRRYLPDGRLDVVIDVDAPHVTSCCLGGDDLRTLYISTARQGMDADALATHPSSGSLFAVRTDVAGHLPFRFDP